MQVKPKLISVTFRLEKHLVERLRRATSDKKWPPGPTQTEIVARGIELVLQKLERAK